MKYTEFYRGGRPVGPVARLSAGRGNAPLHDRESGGVLPEVIWMGQASAEAYEPGEREVCISIRDLAAPRPDVSPKFLAVLSLEFDDDPEPGWEERGRSITEKLRELVVAPSAKADRGSTGRFQMSA